VLANAGVTPRDSADQQYLSAISLPPCAEVAATLQVNPAALDFSATVGAANPAAKKLTLTTSAGNGFWNVARPHADWLSVSPGSGTAPSQVSVNVQSSGLPAGVHYASINVAAADTSNSPIVVPITLTVAPGAAEPSNPPQITTPAAGSAFSGSTVAFSWSANGKNVKNWRLLIGSAKGAKDLYDSKIVGTTRLSRTVRNVPTDGRPIWVQLQFKIDGTWQSADYAYQAASQ
jgi:hypothetical protein